MARRLPTLIPALLCALLIAGSGTKCWCQSVQASMLSQLIQAGNTNLNRQAHLVLVSSDEDARLLALDLVTYRWAVRASGLTPDVKNIDSIIKALDQQSNDATLRWAEQTFLSSGRAAQTGPPPPASDPRGQRLLELLDSYSTALQYEDSRPDDAIAAFENAKAICLDLGLKLTAAQTSGQLGDYYYFRMSQFQLAERCYTGPTGAIWVFTTYGCVASSARLLDNYGLLNMTRGHYEAAMDNHKQAAQQWLLLAREDPQNYRYHNLAGLQYMMAGEALMRQGDTGTDKGLQMMIDYGLEEIKIWAHATKSYESLIDRLASVAEKCAQQGKGAKAIELLEWARRDAEASGNLLLRASTYRALGNAYSAANRRADADNMARKRSEVLKTTISIGDSASAKLRKYPYVSVARRNDLLKKMSQEAEAYYQLGNLANAAQIWSDLASVQSKYGLTEDSVQSLRSLASIYEENKLWNSCLLVRLEAAKAARKANKLTLTASIVTEMIDGCAVAHDLTDALEVLTEFGSILEIVHDTRGIARVMERRATLQAENGQPDTAINDYKNARASYLNIGDIWEAASVALKLAAAQNSTAKPEDARGTLESALQDVDKFTYESRGQDSDPGHTATIVGLYRDLASLYVTTGRQDSAEALLDRTVHYRWFPELMNQLEKGNDQAVVKFAKEFDYLKSQEMDNGGPFNNRLSVLADDWGAFSVVCRMLREQNPSAYNAMPINPLDIYSLRWKLPPKVAVIAYLVTDSGVYAFLCGRDQAHCWQLSASAVEVGASVKALRDLLTECEKQMDRGLPVPPAADWKSPEIAEIRRPLVDLYRQLLAPLISDIASGAQCLVFALPRELVGLPMHALIRNGQDSPPRFLVQDYAVSYLSEGMLNGLVCSDGAAIDPRTDRLSILADPVGKLPGALKEANSIADVYAHSQRYTGAKATVSRLMIESQTAHILHIATHHSTNPNATKLTLVLAGEGSTSDSLDAETLSKVHNDKLKLVVLSACDTISSSDPISNGASCVAELFSRAGAQSVMGGLWRVSDDSAGSLMTDFYRQLTLASTKADALRLAQLKMIAANTYAHPFYWACFALYGNPW